MKAAGTLRPWPRPANYAWANRQIIMHLARESIMTALGMSPRDLGLHLLYDVAHNIAKMEKHTIDGREQLVCVHRKGATRAFPPGHPDLPPGIPQGRPASAHPRRHGPGFVRAGRGAGSHAGILRVVLPRRGPAAQPRRRQESGQGPGSGSRTGRRRHRGQVRGPHDSGRRNARSLQRRQPRGGRGCTARAWPERRPGCGPWGS